MSENHVAFVAGGLTVLDAWSGVVMVREPDARSVGLYDTTQGILVGTAASRFFEQPQYYRMFAKQGSGFAWQAECDLWHLAQEHLICVDSHPLVFMFSGIFGLRVSIRVQARSLANGRVLWSYDTGGSGGEALDAKGRLMLTNEEWVDEKFEGTSNGYAVSGTASVGRVKKLTVLDLESGRVLATTDVRDVTLRGWSGSDPPDHEFDGERVVLRRRKGSGPACPERSVRVYTLDLAGQTFRARDDCEPVMPASQSPPQPALSEIEQKLGARVHPLEEGELVSFPGFGGTLFELRSKRGHWQAVLPRSPSETQADWRFTRAFERRGRLFIESMSWQFGALDCIDLESGRPLWRYVFPAAPVLLSTGVFPPGWVQGLSKSSWRELQDNPPPPLTVLARPIPLEEYLQGQLMEDREGLRASGRPVFDPAGIRSRAPLAWTLIAVGFGLFIVPLGKRFAPPGSMRRVLATLGLFFYLTVVLMFFGRLEFFATAIGKLLLVGAYLQMAVAALRVHTKRRRVLLRVGLSLLLLPLGWFALRLLLWA